MHSVHSVNYTMLTVQVVVCFRSTQLVNVRLSLDNGTAIWLMGNLPSSSLPAVNCTHQ